MLRRRGQASTHQVIAGQVLFIEQLLEQPQVKFYSGAQHAPLVELLVSKRAVEQHHYLVGHHSFWHGEQPEVRQQKSQRGLGTRSQEREVDLGKEKSREVGVGAIPELSFAALDESLHPARTFREFASHRHRHSEGALGPQSAEMPTCLQRRVPVPLHRFYTIHYLSSQDLGDPDDLISDHSIKEGARRARALLAALDRSRIVFSDNVQPTGQPL